ncbi:MAG: ATP-binding cassette domain-containing protein, partial [Hymenobacter sp.]
MDAVTFSKLEIEGWRQFDDVNITLHPRLTVITGANGSGKSTLLSILIRHFGLSRGYLSTPIKDKQGSLSYISGIINNLWHSMRIGRADPNMVTIGNISYSNGIVSLIRVPPQGALQYNVDIPSQQSVLGIHIDSYRPVPNYTQVGAISLQPMTADQSYSNYNSEITQRYFGNHTNSSPLFRLKESIISMSIFGEGNIALGRNENLIRILSGFNEVLRNILPESLGFQNLAVRSPDVVLITHSGDFLIDSASGGIMTLIDVAWRIYMFSINRPCFVVTMDEPENHLHPSMQRSLMRRLLKAFPQVQFIIATHSPFMVSSVKDSNVYVLQYGRSSSPGTEVEQHYSVGQNASRVTSLQLTNVNKAASTSDILRDVLGVPATMPEWVE